MRDREVMEYVPIDACTQIFNGAYVILRARFSVPCTG